MPINRFESPEVGGRTLSLAMITGVGGVQTIRQAKAENPDATYIFTKEERLYKSDGMHFHVDVGIKARWEAIARYRWDTPLMVGGKWQLIGGSRKDNTKGWKMAVAGLAGSSSYNHNADFSNRSNNYQSDSEAVVGEFNLINGYRVSDDIVWFGSTYAAWYDVNGNMKDRSAIPFRTAGWSWQYGQTAGLELNAGSVSLKVELGIARGSYKNQITRWNYASGATLGVHIF